MSQISKKIIALHLKYIEFQAELITNLQTLSWDNHIIQWQDQQLTDAGLIDKINTLSSSEIESVWNLDLSRNNLTTIPQVLSLFSNVMIINVSNNQLTELPEIFFRLSRLQILIIQNNNIENFPTKINLMRKFTYSTSKALKNPDKPLLIIKE